MVFFPPRGHQLHLWTAVLWALRKLTHSQSSSLKACYSVGGGGSAIGTSGLEENCDFSGEYLHFFSSLGRSPSRTGNMLCLCPHFIPSLEDTAKGLFMNDEWMQKASWYRILSSDLIQLSIYEPSTALSSRCPSGHIYLFLLLSLCPWA